MDAVPAVIGPGQAQAAAAATGQAAWRSGLTPSGCSDAAAPWHHASDCPPWGRVHHQVGPPPLEGGTLPGRLLANRRLTVRYERRAGILQAFLHLACALICARRLEPL